VHAKIFIKLALRATIRVPLPEQIVNHLAAKGIVRETELLGLQEVFKRIRTELNVYAEIPSTEKDLIVRGEKKYIDTAADGVAKMLSEMVIPVEKCIIIFFT
jgi:hypothetical protein